MNDSQYTLEEKYSNTESPAFPCNICNKKIRGGYSIVDGYFNYRVAAVCSEECFNMWLMANCF